MKDKSTVIAELDLEELIIEHKLVGVIKMLKNICDDRAEILEGNKNPRNWSFAAEELKKLVKNKIIQKIS